MSSQDKTRGELQNGPTEIKKAHEELKKSSDNGNVTGGNTIVEFNLSETRFENTLDDLLEGYKIISYDWTFLYVNKVAAHQLFREPKDLVGKQYKEVFPGFEKTEIFSQYRKCMEERIPLKFDSLFKFENGIEKWFELSISPVKEGMIVLTHDATERKQAEEDLRIKEERYRLLAESAKDVIWTMKPDGTITYISPAIEQLRGYTVEEAMTQPFDKILTPDSQAVVFDYLQKLNTAFESGLPLPTFRGENEYYCKDGTTLWTEVIVYPMASSDGKSLTLFGVTRDNTERKKYEAQLLEQANNLKELNATKDKFFSIIAHDLKNPFNSILGFSEMLKEEAHSLDSDSIVKYSANINASAKKTYRLLENLLSWAMMQRGSIPFEPKNMLLKELIRNEIENLSYAAEQKNITLTDDIREEITVYADQVMMSTVLRNLILNAIKFTHSNGKVNIGAEIKGERVEISVSDSGIGMDAETIGKLFKIETSFSSPGTENEKGSGLGLLLCNEFVEKHGGKMAVVSEEGKGSTFKFSVPCGKA